MSQNPSKPSLRKTQKDALGRIQSLEESIPQIIQGVNGAFGQMNQQLGGIQETLEAIVGLMGKDAVESAIEDLRVKRAAEQAEAQKAAVAEAVKAGSLVPAKVIGEQTLVIGTECDKDGKVVGNGRVQLPLQSIKPEFKEKLLGKEIGVTFDLPAGGKFTATEIYDAVEKAPEAPAEPAAEALPAKPCTSCEGCPGGCEKAPEAPAEKA